jgi:hypothetical protein
VHGWHSGLAAEKGSAPWREVEARPIGERDPRYSAIGIRAGNSRSGCGDGARQRQSLGVQDGRERVTACARVVDSLTRPGVSDAEIHAHVCESAAKHPKAPIDSARVEHLDHQLDVVLIEEPKVAGVRRQGHGVRRPARSPLTPSSLHPEARVSQTKAGRGAALFRAGHSPALDQQGPRELLAEQKAGASPGVALHEGICVPDRDERAAFSSEVRARIAGHRVVDLQDHFDVG